MKSGILALVAVVVNSGAAASLGRRAGTSSNLPSGWTYSGCYTDNVPGRVLTGGSYADGANMTEESCIGFCNQRGFSFAGVEYGQECYCDYQLANSSTLRPDSECNMQCSGNSAEACGAGNRLTVFTNGGGPPTTNPGPNGWQSLGCYTDSSAKTLVNMPQTQLDSSNMTVATCTSACRASGYAYAGVEYGGECYCGFWVSNDGAQAADGCSMTCNGNKSEFCGGSNRLNLYQLPNATAPAAPTLPSGWSALGCWTDNVHGRTLTTGEPVPGGYTNMTVENCLAACQSNGFSLAGVEYSQECFCANEVSNGGACASDSQTCNMPCRGNVNQLCGGSNRLNMYQYGAGPASACAIGAAAPSSSSVTSVISISTSTSTSISNAPTPFPTSSASSSSDIVTSTSTTPTSTSTTTTTDSPTSTASSFITSTTSDTPSTSSTTSIFTTSTTTVPSSTSTTSSILSTTTTISTTSTTDTPSTPTSSTTTPISSSSTSATSTTATTTTSISITSISTTSSYTTSFPTPVTSTSTSTSVAVAACTPVAAGTSYGSLTNGGFENGQSPWTIAVSQGVVTTNITSDSSYAGCQALSLTPVSGTVKRATLSQALSPALTAGRVYTLTMYQGRATSALTTSTSVITITIGSTVITTGPSCSGATCTVAGRAGSVWQKITVPFVAPVGGSTSTLSVAVTWTDVAATAPILFDEISLVPRP